jgi:hypothetical protein
VLPDCRVQPNPAAARPAAWAGADTDRTKTFAEVSSGAQPAAWHGEKLARRWDNYVQGGAG